MNKPRGLLAVIAVTAGGFFCSSDDIGRRIDPGYDEYLKRRSYDQEMRDKRKQEEAERDLIGGGKSNEQAIKRFNESVKLKTPPANDSIKDRKK